MADLVTVLYGQRSPAFDDILSRMRQSAPSLLSMVSSEDGLDEHLNLASRELERVRDAINAYGDAHVFDHSALFPLSVLMCAVDKTFVDLVQKLRLELHGQPSSDKRSLDDVKLLLDDFLCEADRTGRKIFSAKNHGARFEFLELRYLDQTAKDLQLRQEVWESLHEIIPSQHSFTVGKILHEPPFSLLDNGETLAQRFGRRGLFENRPDQTGDVIAFNSEKIAHPSMRPGPDLTD